MPYKLLGNLIKAPAVHQAGEIVDLDGPTADNLKKRGLVQEVSDAATHFFGQNREGYSLGGRPVHEEAAPAAQPQAIPPAAPADPVPQTTTTHAEPLGPSAATHQPSVAQQIQQPPKQPTAAEIAATVASVN